VFTAANRVQIQASFWRRILADSTSHRHARPDLQATLAARYGRPVYRVAGPALRLLQCLWLAWAALLGLAIVSGNLGEGHGSPVATWARMGSSVALVITAWIGVGLWRATSAGLFSSFVAVGMTLGAIGDFFNAELLDRFAPLGNPVLGGMISFGLGHVAYIIACLTAARRANLRDRRVTYGCLAVWLIVATIGWYVIVYAGADETTRDLVWPALPYSLLLASTAGLATGLAAQNRIFRLLAIGAGLFFLSDMILACGLFRGALPYQTEQVWLSYGPGQMLIVFGAFAACPLLAIDKVVERVEPTRAGAGG
jgi:hypothetical protein